VFCESDDGIRLLTAPAVAHFADDVTEWCGDFTTLKKDIITIRAIGRTVCYRIRPVTPDGWMTCTLVADKVYDDADVKEAG
jgi:hypothetical protein